MVRSDAPATTSSEVMANALQRPWLGAGLWRGRVLEIRVGRSGGAGNGAAVTGGNSGSGAGVATGAGAGTTTWIWGTFTTGAGAGWGAGAGRGAGAGLGAATAPEGWRKSTVTHTSEPLRTMPTPKSRQALSRMLALCPAEAMKARWTESTSPASPTFSPS